jgi:pectinesterase
VIEPAGWSIWSSAVGGNTQNVTFAEYANYGPGSVLEEGPRANFSTQLNAAVSKEIVLGDGYENQWWVDMSYL